MRFYLGVHKFAPVATIKLEMDWLDCKYTRWLNMIRLFNRISAMDDTRLPKIVYKWDVSLGLQTWASEINQIANTTGLTLHFGYQCDVTKAYNTFLRENRNDWKTEANLKPKLRTFNKINYFDTKQTVTNPIYLDIKEVY